MPKVDPDFRPRRELEEPLYLDFMASRPPAGARPEPAAFDSTSDDRPLHLDHGRREPRRWQPWATYHGFAGDSAAGRPAPPPRPVRRSRSRRGLLAVGLTTLVGLAVAIAVWTYPTLEHRPPAGGSMLAVTASPASSPTQVATVRPPAELNEAKMPAELDASALAPSPALREGHLTEPAPEVAKPARQTSRQVRRPRTTSAGLAATARANTVGAYAPESTLSGQMAASSGRVELAR